MFCEFVAWSVSQYTVSDMWYRYGVVKKCVKDRSHRILYLDAVSYLMTQWQINSFVLTDHICYCLYVTWWRHQMETFSALLAICAGNSPVPGEFPTQRPVTRSFDVTLICARINAWVNNREAGDLRRYRPHCDVIVMISWTLSLLVQVMACCLSVSSHHLNQCWSISGNDIQN